MKLVTRKKKRIRSHKEKGEKTRYQAFRRWG